MGIRQELENVLGQLITDEGYDLVELQYVKEGGRWIVRVFVDKTGGITVDECGEISEKISSLLDQKNIVPQKYMLEVSSPGLTRALKTRNDFQRNINKQVKINLYVTKCGLKQFVACIDGVDEEKIRFKLDSGEIIDVNLADIASAKPEIKI